MHDLTSPTIHQIGPVFVAPQLTAVTVAEVGDENLTFFTAAALAEFF